MDDGNFESAKKASESHSDALLNGAGGEGEALRTKLVNETLSNPSAQLPDKARSGQDICSLKPLIFAVPEDYGVTYLKNTLQDTLRNFDANGDNQLSSSELHEAQTAAGNQGDARKSLALDFAMDHFEQLHHLSSEGDSVSAEHAGINSGDISELSNYDSFISSGKWAGKSPLYSSVVEDRAKVIGSFLGLTGEIASFASPVALVGLATLSANVLAQSTLESLKDGVANGRAWALSPEGAKKGALEGLLYGPRLGAYLVPELTKIMGENFWMLDHGHEFSSMYKTMRAL